MICPKCGYEQAIYDDINEWWHCPQCHGTGEVQMNNEKWLRNLSFNELARVLYCMIINGERIRPDLAYIKRWLNEKHDGE